MICLTRNQAKLSLYTVYKEKKILLTENIFLKENGCEGLNKKKKRRVFNCFHFDD